MEVKNTGLSYMQLCKKMAATNTTTSFIILIESPDIFLMLPAATDKIFSRFHGTFVVDDISYDPRPKTSDMRNRLIRLP